MLKYTFEDSGEIVDTIIRSDADKRNVPFNKLVEGYVNQKARVGHKLHTVAFDADDMASVLVFVEEVPDEPAQVWGA